MKINWKRSVCYSRKMTSSDVPIKAEGQERQRANTNVWRLLLFPAAFIGCSLEASDKKGSFWNWSAWKWGVADNIWTPDIWESTKITRLHVELQERQQKAGDHPLLILKIGSWILNTWLNQDFEYSAQSRFWILLFGPDLTWRLEIGGWGIGRGGEGFGLCSRGACGPLGGFQSQTSGQEQADNTTFNPTSSSTSC